MKAYLQARALCRALPRGLRFHQSATAAASSASSPDSHTHAHGDGKTRFSFRNGRLVEVTDEPYHLRPGGAPAPPPGPAPVAPPPAPSGGCAHNGCGCFG
eukprot:TRINITY_DN3544_c0_g1_i1.p3 TRINITY_DN3544_c0_g1~~TRINITY_DN3544_c0_g1_i1.p3  ORF type:complete len:111 (-),score=10.86 TRINITY_DN3544_c0_g1_i1:411-710(-)